MPKNHKRNVSGMHRARRCQAETQDGQPCGAPAVKQQEYCVNHRDKTAAQIPLSSSARSKAARQRAQWKASLMQRFGNAIQKLEQSGATRAVVAELENIRRGLAEIGRQEEAERLGPRNRWVP
jgi:hypothetical protein